MHVKSLQLHIERPQYHLCVNIALIKRQKLPEHENVKAVIKPNYCGAKWGLSAYHPSPNPMLRQVAFE